MLARCAALGLLVAALLFPALADACSCKPRGAPCDAAHRVDAIFAGRATFVFWLPGMSERIVRFNVKEGFKGNVDGTVYVRTGLWGGDCGFDFSRGEEYLVYATLREGRLYTSICTRTQPLHHATEDLAYLRVMHSLPPTSRIYGSVKLYTFDRNFKPKAEQSLVDHYPPPEEDLYSIAPLSGRKVVIEGPSGAREMRTDEQGRYDFSDLIPGEYAFGVDLPSTMRQFESKPLNVKPAGCAQVDVRTVVDGRIRGILTTADGKPAARVLVLLIRAEEGENAEEEFRRDLTRDDGTFEFDGVPAGAFLVGVNITRSQWFSDRYPRTFSPGVSNASAAHTVLLKEGEQRELPSFALAPQPTGNR